LCKCVTLWSWVPEADCMDWPQCALQCAVHVKIQPAFYLLKINKR
jgi:hypothetical protein